jgi:hypothetical protein
MFEGFQFPKSILVWIEAHPGTAGWLQAVGATAIIIATVHISGADRRERLRTTRLRAQGMAILLHTEMLAFRGTLERVIDKSIVSESRVQAPTILYKLIEDLYLLGPAGGDFLQMLSALGANNVFVDGLIPLMSSQRANDEAWPQVKTGMVLALEACDSGITGLQKIMGP